MASLMDDLVTLLCGERDLYEKLIPISEEKTKALVDGNLQVLEEISGREQQLVDKAAALGKKREEAIAGIAQVLNKDPATLNLTTLAQLLDKQPEEKKRIIEVHDSLKQVMDRLVSINQKNQNLIENSLEMIEFNMNYIQSTRMSPGVNNYDKSASSDKNAGYIANGFDAKQ